MIYLDWASTAVPDIDALEQALALSRRIYANPSSAHPAGREARAEMERWRAVLAGHLGCDAGELVFTSGGTESNWIVISSLLRRAGRTARVVSSGIEHPSVHDNLSVLEQLGFEVVRVPARPDGIVDTPRLLEAVDGRTTLVTLMYVNNVTGALQPVAQVARALRERRAAGGRRVHLHTDAVQALGKVELDLGATGADSAALSAHKIGGPRGVGALYLRSGSPFEALSRGGEQERGIRPGTENLAGAAGFALAAARRLPGLVADRSRAASLHRELTDRLTRIPGCRLLPLTVSEPIESSYSPFIRACAFPPVPSEVLVRALGDEGILVSAGSACASSNREKRERVYRAMGTPEDIAGSAIRISLGHATTADDILALAQALERITPRLREVSQGRKAS